MNRASFWEKKDDGKCACLLCPHGCVIAEGKHGLCGTRLVRNGQLVAAGYGRISSAGMDPIEKKPLYHFYPGSAIFSIGGYGCNFHCKFCQNWSISQKQVHEDTAYSPQDIVNTASQRDSAGIAYTYNEPLINFEFVRDCASVASDAGLKNVLVTNGFVNPEPAQELARYIDALNIDIKSMDDSFYRERCAGALRPVLDFASFCRERGTHVEITNLIIPGLNDTDDHFSRLADWVGSNLGITTPLHLSAYRPEFKMNTEATPLSTMQRAGKLCSETLYYVYLGNVMTPDGQNTLCPACSNTLVQRSGYRTVVAGIENGHCSKCGSDVDFVME